MCEELCSNAECYFCQETILPTDERAEMYDPTTTGEENVICHVDCGLSRGYEVA